LKDYAAASQTFQRGSHVPGSNPALKILAAAMAQHGGETQTARLMWMQIYNSTEDKTIRAHAVKRLQALRVDEDVVRLQRELASYQRVTGHFPASWSELRATGWNESIIDPVGLPYRLKPDGRIEVQDPDQLPFLTHGLPPDRVPALYPSTQAQREAIKAVEASGQPPPPEAPASRP